MWVKRSWVCVCVRVCLNEIYLGQRQTAVGKNWFWNIKVSQSSQGANSKYMSHGICMWQMYPGNSLAPWKEITILGVFYCSLGQLWFLMIRCIDDLHGWVCWVVRKPANWKRCQSQKQSWSCQVSCYIRAVSICQLWEKDKSLNNRWWEGVSLWNNLGREQNIFSKSFSLNQLIGQMLLN